MAVRQFEAVNSWYDETNGREKEVRIEGSDLVLVLTNVNNLKALAEITGPDKDQIEYTFSQG